MEASSRTEIKTVLIVGASGAGKDTLLRAASSHFADKPSFRFVRRYITRMPDDNEANYFVDAQAFSILSQSGFFVSHWQAHRNWYGIARHALDETPAGGLAIVSVSRSAIADFERSFHHVVTIEVKVCPEILRKRLKKRGRECEKDREKRLERAQQAVQAENLIPFDNSAEREATIPTFLELLGSLSTR